MKRGLIFAYGAICYVISLATFVYTIGFVGNFAVPTTLDGSASGPLGAALANGLRAAAQCHGTSGIQKSVDAYRT
jgi:hypothetical protein